MTYRWLLHGLVLTALVIPATAQDFEEQYSEMAAVTQGPKGKGGGNKAKITKRRFSGAKKILGLTEAQISAIKALHTLHKETIRKLAPQGKKLGADLRAAITNASDPTQVGQLVLDRAAFRKKISSLNEKLKEDLMNVLTTFQQEQVKAIYTGAMQAKALAGLWGNLDKRFKNQAGKGAQTRRTRGPKG